MDAALGFRRGHPLHTMAAGLELELRIRAEAEDLGNHFLIAAEFALAFGNEFDFPSGALGVAHVHAEQVAREQSGFIPAGAGPDLQEYVALVAGVPGQQQLL